MRWRRMVLALVYSKALLHEIGETADMPVWWAPQDFGRLGCLRWIALQGVQGLVFRVATTSAHGQLDSNCPSERYLPR